MTWFTGNLIDWTTSDEKILHAYKELTGEVLDLSKRNEFDTDARYLHDAIYPTCACVPNLLSFHDSLTDTEEKYKAINHQNKVTKGLF